MSSLSPASWASRLEPAPSSREEVVSYRAPRGSQAGAPPFRHGRVHKKNPRNIFFITRLFWSMCRFQIRCLRMKLHDRLARGAFRELEQISLGSNREDSQGF